MVYCMRVSEPVCKRVSVPRVCMLVSVQGDCMFVLGALDIGVLAEARVHNLVWVMVVYKLVWLAP